MSLQEFSRAGRVRAALSGGSSGGSWWWVGSFFLSYARGSGGNLGLASCRKLERMRENGRGLVKVMPKVGRTGLQKLGRSKDLSTRLFL